MSYDLIEVIPLTNDYTQIPNALISADIDNNLFRALCWLLSLRGGSVSSRQIAQGARLGYDGKPHRRVMRELRERGIMTSVRVNDERGFGEFLRIDLNNGLSGTAPRVLSVRAKRPNVRAKRPNLSAKSSEPLKTNCDGARPLPKSEARPVAETTSDKQRVARSLGLPVFCQKTGELMQ